MITNTELREMVNCAEIETVKLSHIKYDKKKYSRVDGIDRATVNEYSKNFIDMPAMILNKNYLIVNGVHRYHALLKANQEQAKAKIINIDDDDIDLAGLYLDKDYGVRHPEKDFKNICIKRYSPKPEENKRLYEFLDIPQRTFYEWTKDIRKEQQKQVNSEMALALLNPYRTQQEIADDFGCHLNTVNKFRNNLFTVFADYAKCVNVEQKQDFEKALDGKELDFLEDYLKFEPYLYDIWNLKEKDGTNSHFGHFPITFMNNLLYYFTKPFDLVYDPFAGGGTTIDSCRFMFRKCICSDLNPVNHRKDEIIEHDIANGLPDNLPKPQLVFLDPPYWKQAENKYSDSKNDLGNMSLDDFNAAMRTFLEELKAKKIERIAIVIQPTQYKNDFVYKDHIFDFYDMIKDQYEIEMRYSLPYSTQQYLPQMVVKAKGKIVSLVLKRDLVVWKLNKN